MIRYARLRRVTLHVEEAGDPQQPPVILLHGPGHAGRMWKPQVAALSRRFHVLTPDLPGFGRSPGPFQFQTASEAIFDLAARQRRPAYLCGLSAGAMVAMKTAAEHADVIAGLIVSGAQVTPAQTAPKTLRLYRRIPGWTARLFSDVENRSGWHDLIDELAAADLTSALPLITAPTLVLCGSRDRANLPAAHLITDCVAGAHLWVVPHVGHMWNAQAPKLFNDVVAQFVSSCEARRLGR